MSYTALDALPGAVRPAKQSLDGSMIWLYGIPKIGKTTTAASFPGAWFIATEKGDQFVSMRPPTYINSWPEFIELCQFIAKTKPTKFEDGTPIKTLVIDTYDKLFRHCNEHICDGMGLDDLGEIDHGKGWSRLTKEWDRVMTKVRAWPFTLVCISHVRDKEFKTKGRKTHRKEPAVGAAGFRWAQAAADLILYAHMDEVVEYGTDGEVTGEIKERRVFQCHPSSFAVAGGRMASAFQPKIEIVPEGASPSSYDNLMSGFKK